MGLSHVQKLAEKYLDEYKTNIGATSYQEVDINHPQYAAMALYQACKSEKVRVSKVKLVGFSHLKMAQWEVLEKSWNSWITKRLEEKKLNKTLVEEEAAGDQDVALMRDSKAKDIEMKSTETKINSYSSWRDDILQKAYKDLTSSGRIESIDVYILQKIHGLSNEVEKAAIHFLSLIRKRIKQTNVDIFHPKYSTIAVFQAARGLDAEIDEDDLIEYSLIDKKEWNQLLRTVMKYESMEIDNAYNDRGNVLLKYDDYDFWKNSFVRK